MKRILLISGSTRAGSTNTATLRTAEVLPVDGAETERYTGLSDLPAFNPDHDGGTLPPAVADLRRRIAAADAVLFCTPEYAGALPGSFKNLLDWTVGGGELYGKPVAWITVALREGARTPRRRWRRSSVTWAPSPSSRPVCACPSRAAPSGRTAW